MIRESIRVEDADNVPPAKAARRMRAAHNDMMFFFIFLHLYVELLRLVFIQGLT